MLNDVHFPPEQADRAAKQPNRHHPHHAEHDENTTRVRDRLPTSTRADVPEAIYGEPEDRGDSFNTMMSASVVTIVLVVVVGLAWIAFL